MDSTSDLPTIIINGILRYAICKDLENLSTYRHVLPFLAINRAWRSCAKKLVYRHVYMNIDSMYKCDPNERLGQNTISAIKAESNIGFHTRTGNSLYATSLDIKILDYKYFEDFIADKDLVRVLDSNDWSNIKEMSYSPSTFSRIALNQQDFIELSKRNAIKPTTIIECIRRNLPNVKKLTIESMGFNMLDAEFSNALMDIYAGQLDRLELKNPKYISPLLNPSARVSLKVNLHSFDSQNHHILNGLAKSLSHLTLPKLPFDFDWRVFSSDNHTKEVIFDHLSVLSLQYSDERNSASAYEQFKNNSKSVPDLVFPSLKKLTIQFAHIEDIELLVMRDVFSCPSLTTLHIEGDFVIEPSQNYFVEQTMSKFAKWCYRQFPNLRKIHSGRFYINDESSQLINKLIPLFSNQLQELNIAAWKNYSAINTSQLVTIYLNNFSIDGFAMAKMSAQTLQYLEIQYVPWDFSWNCNSDGIDLTDIIFAQLKTLVMTFGFISEQSISALDYVRGQNVNSKPGYAVHLPKLEYVDLEIKSFANLSAFLSPISICSKTTKFDLALPEYENFDEDNGDIDGNSNTIKSISVDEQSINALALMFASAFPNVATFALVNINDNPVYEAFGNILLERYSKQAKNLCITSPTIIDGLLLSTDIMSLNLKVKPSHSLVKAAVDSGSGFSNLFGNATFDGQLVLSEVKVILFTTEAASTNTDSSICVASQPLSPCLVTPLPTPIRIIMPRIATLRLNLESCEHNFSNTELVFTIADTVYLLGCIKYLPLHSSSNCYISNSLVISDITVDKSDEEIFYKLTNNWYAHNIQVSYSMLCVPELPFEFDIGRVCWTNLKYLKLEGEIVLSKMVELIEKLPSLKGLEIFKVVFDKIPKHHQTIKTFFGPHKKQFISKTLEQLIISNISNTLADSNWKDADEYLRLHLPSLVVYSVQ